MFIKKQCSKVIQKWVLKLCQQGKRSESDPKSRCWSCVSKGKTTSTPTTRYTAHGTSAKRLRWKMWISTFFKKVPKKWSKNRSKYFSFCFDSNTSALFWQKVSKPVFQNLTARRHLTTPYFLFGKNHEDLTRTDERTNERTDEHTEHSILTIPRT